MVKIVIENLGKKVVVVNDLHYPYCAISIAILLIGCTLCGGKGRCTTCKMIVVTGMENLSSKSEPEQKYFREGALEGNERLSCQAFLQVMSLSGSPTNISFLICGTRNRSQILYRLWTIDG